MENLSIPVFRARFSGIISAAIAAAYLFLILLDAIDPRLAFAFVPGPILYFAQISALFPAAKKTDADFRAEAWSCRDGLYRELDTRPYFRIQAGNKENRFSRAMYFYHNSPRVLSGLGLYLMARADADAERRARSGDAGDGFVGGIRLLSVYDTIPPPSPKPARYLRKPLDAYPAERRRIWYEPSARSLWNACRGHGA